MSDTQPSSSSQPSHPQLFNQPAPHSSTPLGDPASGLAILYSRSGYDTRTQRLMGRQAAGEAFLKAIARYSHLPRLYCYAPDRSDADAFNAQIQSFQPPPVPPSPVSTLGAPSLGWIPTATPAGLAEPGLLYRPDPLIADLAWQRHSYGANRYSLCGITHTLASKEVMGGIGDWLTAPVYPWDAVICTSQAVKTMVEEMLADWAEYLAQRLGAPSRPDVPLQLPVIPLGVDCEAMLTGQRAQAARGQLRQRLGIGGQDLVVLFVGRLIFHAKAHPVPMYLALEQAVRMLDLQPGQRVHLVQSGWFEDVQQEEAFTAGAAQFCPSVNAIFVDGRSPELRQGIWAVADVFISLADNIQETFGLTPLEAMAAGLPVVVSDWNGYRETVRDGVDGFCIATRMPPSGCGVDLAAEYFADSINYSTYVGHSAMATAVDIPACAAALGQLLSQPTLRQRMGAAGWARARQSYDWSVVIRAYEELWHDLDLRRRQVQDDPWVAGGHVPEHPLVADPFLRLHHYPTQSLTPSHRLVLGPMAASNALTSIRQTWMTQFGGSKRLREELVDQVLALIAQSGDAGAAIATLEQHLAPYGPQARPLLYRTLGYLLKFDILRTLPHPQLQPMAPLEEAL